MSQLGRKIVVAFLSTKVNSSQFKVMMAVSAIMTFAVPAFSAAPIVSAGSNSSNATQSSSLDSRLQNLEQQVEVRNRVIADMQIQITTLQEEVRMLRGQVEEQDFKLSQVLERQRELYRDIDSRLSSISTPSVSAPNTVIHSGNSNSAITPAMPPEVQTTPKTTTSNTSTANKGSAKNAEAEANAYDAIFPLVRNKQYAEAVQAYADFLKKYPDGKNAHNAHYWWGQVHYVNAQWEEAETQFKMVVTRYPDSGKASDALLKLGEIEKKRGANDAARAYFQQVVSKYSGTSAAQQAQRSLQDLR